MMKLAVTEVEQTCNRCNDDKLCMCYFVTSPNYSSSRRLIFVLPVSWSHCLLDAGGWEWGRWRGRKGEGEGKEGKEGGEGRERGRGRKGETEGKEREGRSNVLLVGDSGDICDRVV